MLGECTVDIDIDFGRLSAAAFHMTQMTAKGRSTRFVTVDQLN